MTYEMETIKHTTNELKEKYYALIDMLEEAENVMHITYAEVIACENSTCTIEEAKAIYDKHDEAVEDYNSLAEDVDALKKAIDKLNEAYYIIRGI